MSFSSPLRRIFSASLLTLACGIASPATARDATTERAKPARTAEPDRPEAATWTAGTAPAGDCTHARRKLWQPERGWIVKSVTTCH